MLQGLQTALGRGRAMCVEKEILIVGNGGFGREVRWLIERINSVKPTWNIRGFVDEDQTSGDVVCNDAGVLEMTRPISLAFGIGSPAIREKIYNRYKVNPCLEFPNLVDPSVLLSDSVKLGRGNIICAGTIATVDITIGNFNIINLDCTIGHDAVVKDFVTINPGANISGSTCIANRVEIGTGTKVIQGVTIEQGAIVGAGAVVSRDIEGNCTAVGVPAKVIKRHAADAV